MTPVEEIIANLVKCDGMSARISERQCKINQARCRAFAQVATEYFKSTGKNRQYGASGLTNWVDPTTLACLQCERYRVV
jgi:hypothetical protein